VLDVPLQALQELELLVCGRLNGVVSLLPNPELFLYAYVRGTPVAAALPQLVLQIAPQQL